MIKAFSMFWESVLNSGDLFLRLRNPCFNQVSHRKLKALFKNPDLSDYGLNLFKNPDLTDYGLHLFKNPDLSDYGLYLFKSTHFLESLVSIRMHPFKLSISLIEVLFYRYNIRVLHS